jgi:hypothetical protein
VIASRAVFHILVRLEPSTRKKSGVILAEARIQWR